MAFFLFGTLPGMEKFQSESQSESDSASDEETATTDSNTEITTLEITLESKEETEALDSKTLTDTEDSNLAEHAPLTPESLEDPPNLSLFLPDSPIPVVNSGSNSPGHISPSPAEQSEISKTAAVPKPTSNKNSILKPKLIKKSTTPAAPPSTNKTAISKPKIAKKLEPAANKKVISKLNIAKKDTKAGKDQARPTPITVSSTKAPQGRKVVNGKNIKDNASKGLKKSDEIAPILSKKKPTTIAKNDSDKSENISVTKKGLKSKSQSEKASTNNSPNPSSRKRPSSQPSTKENVKVPKLDISSDKTSTTTTGTIAENKKSSVTKPAKTTPKSALTSKAKQNKECPKPATPIKPMLQKKTPTVVPIQPKLNKNSVSTKTRVKNNKSTKPIIKIKLNNASLTKQNSKSVATKPSAPIKPTKSSAKAAQSKTASPSEKAKPQGRPPKPTSNSLSVSNKAKSSAKTAKNHKAKGKLKKTSTVRSGPIDFKIDPFSPIVIYTSPHLNKPDTNSHLNTPDIKKEVLLDIKLEPTEEGTPPTEPTTCEVLQTYAKGEWEWMPGHPYFSPELELVRLDDCMCLN